MPQCIVLDVTDTEEWIHQIDPHPRGARALGLHVPPKSRPALVHDTREDARKEACRLALMNPSGEYAVFELVEICKGHGSVPRWKDGPGLMIW